MPQFSAILQVLDYLGTFAFGLSGAMVGVRKGMDVFGIVVLATVTAIGGGTVRDALLGRTPIFWMTDATYLYLAVVAGLIPFLAFRTVERGSGALAFFDAVGLGVFTVIGASLALQAQVCGIGVVALAAMTGVGGGMIRDVLAGEMPIVLREEVYASASIGGAIVLWAGIRLGLPLDAVAPISALLVVLIRMLSRHYHWHLPRALPQVPEVEK